MEKVSQLGETETNRHVSIAMENDPPSMEQRTMPEQEILEVPHQLHEGTAEIFQLAKGSCNVSVAIQIARTSIEQKQSLPWTKPEKKILRVPHHVLKVNEKAYEPYVISIGPYHHGKDHLKEMEGQKVKYLSRLVQKTNHSVETYLSAIGNMVEEARSCYSEPLNLSTEEFLEMMVLDGCFIIQFFMEKSRDFCHRGLIHSGILHDLVLAENQLPFFVLCKLLDKISEVFFDLEGSIDPKNEFIHHILEAFKRVMPGLRVDRSGDDGTMNNIKHLGHLLHSNWLPSDEKCIMQPKWSFIRSATELREAGIDFKMVETEGGEKSSLFDIKFEKGILKMPKVTIEDNTERLYRNLIVCEQFDYKHPLYLLDYVTLMNSLINSGKDVELLCKRKIIKNLLGDDESVATMFNRLGDHTTFSSTKFYYAQLFKEVNEHYEKPWNGWKANLRHKYFNTPWASISFLAATLLVLLTVVQTIFTIFRPS